MEEKIDISELLIVSFLGVRIPRGEKKFTFSKTPRPALGPTQSSIQGVPVFFSGVKWTGLEVSHSSPSVVEVKIEWSYTSSPPICGRGVDMANFFLYFPFAVYWQRKWRIRSYFVMFVHPHVGTREPLQVCHEIKYWGILLKFVDAISG